jgi:hypothetical protein
MSLRRCFWDLNFDDRLKLKWDLLMLHVMALEVISNWKLHFFTPTAIEITTVASLPLLLRYYSTIQIVMASINLYPSRIVLTNRSLVLGCFQSCRLISIVEFVELLVLLKFYSAIMGFVPNYSFTGFTSKSIHNFFQANKIFVRLSLRLIS